MDMRHDHTSSNKTTSSMAVLGAGAWGSALACVFARHGHTVRLWGPDSMTINQRRQGVFLHHVLDTTMLNRISANTDLATTLLDVETIIIAVPSVAVREVLMAVRAQRESLHADSKDLRVVWGTKGLDPNAGAVFSEVVRELMGDDCAMAALSGPSFAEEVMAGKPTAVNIAGNNQALLNDLKSWLTGPAFHAVIIDDLIGLQWCGVLKNILAMATGICDGLTEHSANCQAALMVQGIQECQRACVAFGGAADTFYQYAGIGDIILTCTDDQSRNRRFGLAIGRGQSAEQALKEIGQAVEGYYNLAQIWRRLQEKTQTEKAATNATLADTQALKMPITCQLYNIIYRNAPADALLSTLSF